LHTFLQDDAIFPVKPWLELGDAIYVNNRRSMNSYEPFGIELSFKRADRVSQQIGFLPSVKPNIVSLGLEPIYLIGFHKKDVSVHLDHQPFQMNRLGFDLLECVEDSLIERLALIDSLAARLQGLL